MKRLHIYLLITLFAIQSCQNKSEQIKKEFDFNIQLTEKEKNDGILTPELLWKFGRVSNPQVSPDGTNILYSVTYYELATNKSRTSLYIVPVEGGEPRKAVNLSGSQFDQQWLSDDEFAFISVHEGSAQVYKTIVNTDKITKLTNVESEIDGFKISPDQSQILFSTKVKAGQNLTDKNPDLPLLKAMAYNDLMARHWNHWKDENYSHIFFASLKNTPVKSGTDIMPNEEWDAPMSPYFDFDEICWTPDGKQIVYTCKKLIGVEAALSTDSDIYLYDIETKTTKNLTQCNFGYDRNPAFSPDGKYMAYLSMKTPGCESDLEKIILKNMETGETQNLTEHWDQCASNLVWDSNNRTIFFISGINATYQIYSIDISTKNIIKHTQGHHDYKSIAVTSNNLVGAKTTHAMSAEIFRIERENNSEHQITFTNQTIYDHIAMGKSEEKWVETSDGKKMLVWLIYPPKFDAGKKYPAILFCQGGPQSAVSQFFSFRWNFQIMAANDYIIIAPNRRGVPTFGAEWNAQISGDYSGQNIQDYLSAIDHVKKEPFIDNARLGCVGASYGGYSVFYLAGHHQNRFKAFISHCGMFNFESFYGSTEELFFPNYDFGGPYWDKSLKTAQRTYDNSPHKFVENWNTPILIIHGGNDFRIPYTESLQAFTAAKMKGVDARLLYFPEETHFVLKPQNSVLWQREFFGWLDKYVKTKE